MLIRIVIASASFLLLNLISTRGVLRLLLYLAVYLIIGYDILRKAVRGILNGRVFDENFLMALATVGALALAIYDQSGDYNEAIAVMLFYQIGEFFQSYAVGKSRKSIGKLMDIRPDYANIEFDGELQKIDPVEVSIGSIIVVRPGERIPIDGRITEGVSTLNTVALTGESTPRDVAVGDEVISGCINVSGLIKIQTQKLFVDSTVSKILELTENASSRKSHVERFISRFARIYTPIVCICALLLAVLPPLILIASMQSAQWSVWIYRALTFLVISCPCALVISIPLSFFAGIGCASREGILIKGSNYLELLSKLGCVAFDKTGTLTEGIFEVSDIQNATVPHEELLELAALAESSSSHPISKSLQKAYKKELDRRRVSNVTEIGGNGVLATVDGHCVAVGNEKLMNRIGVRIPPIDAHGTLVHVAQNNSYLGTVVIADKIKPQSRAAISELKNAGVDRSVMLTGDTASIAAYVANELKIDSFYAELLPTDKVSITEKLLSKMSDGKKLAFVGDGINDAPVLSRADIGIAMGALGSDAAIEAADVVLMDDNPMQIAKAVRISRKCISIVRQNIVFSLTVKFLCLLLVSLGLANMWIGIFADVGVTVIAVINSIRAMHIGRR